MQSSMGDRMKRAAAAPTRPLDLRGARRRGLVQRSLALFMAALGIASLVTVTAVAYPRLIDTGEDDRSSGSAGTPCRPQQAVKLTAFLQDDATEEELRVIDGYLAESPAVASFDYVSKRAAFEEFKEIYAEHPDYWSHLPGDALPASFRIELEDAAEADDVKEELTRLSGVDLVAGPSPRQPPCTPGVNICEPTETAGVETLVRPPRDGDHVDHVGVNLRATVDTPDRGCATTIYVELDGVPMAPPDGEGPDANEFRWAAAARDACVIGNLVAGDFLYEGRHVIGIGTGCDPATTGPYPTQRTLEFDGDENALWPPVPSHDEDAPHDFCAHAGYLDELRRPPTDEELGDLLRLAPDEIEADASLLVDSARAHREGDDSLSGTDEVLEAADRFDEYVAQKC